MRHLKLTKYRTDIVKTKACLSVEVKANVRER